MTVPSIQWQVGPWSSGPILEVRNAGSRRATFSLMEPNTASFSVESAPSLAKDFNAGIWDLWIIRDGTTLDRQRIVNQSTEFGDTVGQAVTCRDYRHLLSLRPYGTTTTWTATEQATIAWAIITAGMGWGPGLPLTQVAGWAATGVLRSDFTVNPEDNCLQALQNLAQLANGFEPYINPAASNSLAVSLNFPAKGVNNGVVLDYVLRTSQSAAAGAIRKLTRSVDLANYANVVRQSGETGTTPVTVQAAGYLTAPEGVWVKLLGDTSLNTNTMVSGAASANLANYSAVFPEYRCVLRQGYWRGPSHIWLGDTVQYAVVAGDYNVVRTARVFEISIEWDEDNNETVTLSLSKNSLNGMRQLRKELTSLRYLTLR